VLQLDEARHVHVRRGRVCDLYVMAGLTRPSMTAIAVPDGQVRPGHDEIQLSFALFRP